MRRSRQFIEDWSALYANLIERHQVKGIRAFSKTAFVRQLAFLAPIVLRAVL